jgi:hypothetical protein
VRAKNMFNPIKIKKSDILNASDEELTQLRDKLVPLELRVPIEDAVKVGPIHWKLFDRRAAVFSNEDSPKGSLHAGNITDTSSFKEFNGEKVVYHTVVNVDEYNR